MTLTTLVLAKNEVNAIILYDIRYILQMNARTEMAVYLGETSYFGVGFHADQSHVIPRPQGSGVLDYGLGPKLDFHWEKSSILQLR